MQENIQTTLCTTDQYSEYIIIIIIIIIIKRYSNPITGLDRPWEFKEVEAPKFQDSRHMKVARLSALRTGRLYLPGNNLC